VREFLKQCLVDSNGSSKARGRRAGSLLISLALQSALIAAAVLVPLLATGERPRRVLATPLPPYRGVPAAVASGPSKPAAAAKVKPPTGPTWVYQPPRIPTGCSRPEDPSATEGSGEHRGPRIPGIEGGPLPPMIGIPEGAWIAKPPQPPAPPKVAAPVRVSEGVQEARLLERVLPRYPELAKVARLEGDVVLRAIIARDGSVREIAVLRGHVLLVQAAVDAVARWRYRPTLLSGQPVEVETHITVVFRLGG